MRARANESGVSFILVTETLYLPQESMSRLSSFVCMHREFDGVEIRAMSTFVIKWFPGNRGMPVNNAS